jgi:hypothetical protein
MLLKYAGIYILRDIPQQLSFLKWKAAAQLEYQETKEQATCGFDMNERAELEAGVVFSVASVPISVSNIKAVIFINTVL